MTKQPARFPRHLHAWRDLGSGQTGGWRYRCALCQRRSRNPYYQLPQFRRLVTPWGQTSQTASATTGATNGERKAIERRMQRRRAR